jgi:glycosyltransferase involved in cell wall biosynthesis
MKISIILAVYNEHKYLIKCLESLIKQKNVDYEIIIVDDGSNPPVSKTVVQNLSKNIQLTRINHSGTAVARNSAAKIATGDILVFIDGDMTFEPDFLDTLTKPIKENGAIGTNSLNEIVANWDNVWARCWNFENGLTSPVRVKNESNMTRDFRAVLKKEFKKVNGFDNTGYTDTWSLSRKLNTLPQKTQAKYYHYNPDSLAEVFSSAKWVGKRERKYGSFGKILALIRAVLPFSITTGIIKSFKYKSPEFLIFKLVYDFAVVFGIIETIINKKISK